MLPLFPLFIFSVLIAWALGLYVGFKLTPPTSKIQSDIEGLRHYASVATSDYFAAVGLRQAYPKGTEHPGDALRIAHEADSHISMLRLANMLGVDAEGIMKTRMEWFK